MENLELVNPHNYGIRANILWWACAEARSDYGVTDQDLIQAGVFSTTILIHKDLIEPLQQVNTQLIQHGLEIEIDDGYRSIELYQLAARKVAEKKGQEASSSLFNLEKMPHTSGRSVDVALVDMMTKERQALFDKADGTAASFLGYYEQFNDEGSQEKVRLQKLLGQIMLSHGFRYGTKNEIWHFDFIGN
jgi:D-alanyl-D-alanine dipeptidase